MSGCKATDTLFKKKKKPNTGEICNLLSFSLQKWEVTRTGLTFCHVVASCKITKSKRESAPHAQRPMVQRSLRAAALEQMKRTGRITPGRGTASGPPPRPTEMSPLHGHWHVEHFSEASHKQLWCGRMRSPSRDTLLIPLGTACIFKEGESNQP